MVFMVVCDQDIGDIAVPRQAQQATQDDQVQCTHDAQAAVRSMGQCMAMGQAAGTAAALAVSAATTARATTSSE